MFHALNNLNKKNDKKDLTKFKVICSCFLLLFSHQAYSQWQSGGHTKYQLIHSQYDRNSQYYRELGSYGTNQQVSFRYNIDSSYPNWAAEIHYEMLVLNGETIELFTESLINSENFNSDGQRFFDLSKILKEQEKIAWLHHIDRFNFSYYNASSVLKFGRQTISWGNGMHYNPMDFLNPFDPTAIDTEYKRGDDMIYGQQLFANGNDLQTVIVGRRDKQNNVSSDVISLALKYHAFINNSEVDLLAAKHFDDSIFAIGGVRSLGGSVWRGDLVFTKTDRDHYTSAVTNLSHSWVSLGKNISGNLEYFYNGFGIADGNYRAENLLTSPGLTERLIRGELFTLGREYLSASAVIEITPLCLMRPAIYINLSDDSVLFQIVGQYDFQQNLRIIGAFILPIGEDRTEFGGISGSNDDYFFSRQWSLYGQLAWYF